LSDIYTGRVLGKHEATKVRQQLEKPDPKALEPSQYRPPKQRSLSAGERINPLTGQPELRTFPKSYGCDGGLSQPQFSWLSRDAAEQHIPACAEAGIAVTPYRVLESGLLTGKYRRGQPLPEDSRADDECGWLSEPDEAIYDSIEAFNAEADASGLTAGQYALKWALDQPGLTACVVGVKRIDQIAALMPGCESSD